jgi:hypothetical protein
VSRRHDVWPIGTLWDVGRILTLLSVAVIASDMTAWPIPQYSLASAVTAVCLLDYSVQHPRRYWNTATERTTGLPRISGLHASYSPVIVFS